MSSTQVKLEDFIEAIATDEMQDQEDALYSLFYLMDIDNVEGEPLIAIAKKVGLQTRPTDTATLRRYIKGQIAVNVSTGKFADLYAVLSSFLGVDTGIVKQVFPMMISLYSPTVLTAAEAQDIVNFMQDAASSGVLVHGISPTPISGYFTYDSVTADGYGNGTYIDYYATSELL